MIGFVIIVLFFFFTDTSTSEIYTLSLHDALPILSHVAIRAVARWSRGVRGVCAGRLRSSRCDDAASDRKSTRLNSSHSQISYAVFCLKKKKNKRQNKATQPQLKNHQIHLLSPTAK